MQPCSASRHQGRRGGAGGGGATGAFGAAGGIGGGVAGSVPPDEGGGVAGSAGLETMVVSVGMTWMVSIFSDE